MEATVERRGLRYEQLAARCREQVTIEGETALGGSMRDAVTVLAVTARPCVVSAKAAQNEVVINGKAAFHVLYTQGDLTRVRTLETTCDFTHTLAAPGARAGMRVTAELSAQECEGAASGGRMTLHALLLATAEIIEEAEAQIVTNVPDAAELQMRETEVSPLLTSVVCEDSSLVRNEFDIPQKTGAGAVLDVGACAADVELTGGGGRLGVSGTAQVRVLHRASEPGAPFVQTMHELPFSFAMEADVPPDAQLTALAEITDVVADCAEGEKDSTLRVEAEVRVRVMAMRHTQERFPADLYSLSGPVLVPQTEELRIHIGQKTTQVQESVRIQAALPEDAPPIGTMLAAFALPTLTDIAPAGRRLDAEGVMSLTLLYLPVDSDIPYSASVREPFQMTFPAEVGERTEAVLSVIETTPGSATSDRAEVRCVLALSAKEHEEQTVRVITDVRQEEAAECAERGFVLVWPASGESRWDTARALRVREESLTEAGGGALLALCR